MLDVSSDLILQTQQKDAKRLCLKNLSHAMVTYGHCWEHWELGVTVSKVSNDLQRFATKHPIELEVVVFLIDQTTFGSGLQVLKLLNQLVFTE